MEKTSRAYEQKFAASQFINEENYWLNKLSGEWEKSHFPYDYIKGRKTDFFESAHFSFTGELFSKIMRLSNQSGLRTHMIMVAALTVLLKEYTGSPDILVGSPVLRQKIEANFVNTILVLRNQLNSNMSFKELLLLVKQSIIEATDNQNYPIETLPFQMGIDYTENEDFPFFDVGILLENIHEKSYIRHIKTNMLFCFRSTADSVQGTIEYNCALYEKSTIENIVTHFSQVLNETFANFNTSFSEIDILTMEERTQLLSIFNNTRADYPKDKSICDLFEEQVEAVPGNIAIVFKEQQLTYRELNQRANRLAHLLISKGINQDCLVGVYVERTPEMLIGIIGILKAGGAYLPIAANSPPAGVRYLLQDSGIDILILLKELKEKIDFPNIIPLDEENAFPQHFASHNPINNATPESLLYVIYTSGSTGRPKGVMVNHSGFSNLVCFHREVFGEDSSSRLSQVASPGFDAMAFEIWPCLCSGAALHIADIETQNNPTWMKDWLVRQQITISYQTTVMAQYLLDEEWPTSGVALKALRAAGERLTQFPTKPYPFDFYNLYGPTEDTVWTTWIKLEVTPENLVLPAIGEPISNHRIYILGENLKLKPVGVFGEICIGGDGVTRGYLNQPGLTDERFIENPFAPGEIMYRTGDLGRWMPDGNIEFSARLDHQIKIRGFRVELGEIEKHLQSDDEIKDAAVIAVENERGDNDLYAYIVTGKELNISNLREHLAMYLPNYMIPAYFIELEEMPLNPNGKIDRKRLSKMKGKLRIEKEYLPPRSSTEKQLVQIWENLLDRENIGIYDNFFNIGGDSIKTITLLDATKKAFDIKIQILDLYENETIEKLALKIDNARFTPLHDDSTAKKEILEDFEKLKEKVLEQTEMAENIEDVYPMSDIQKGMMFYSLKDSDAHVYHNQVDFQLKVKNFKEEIFYKAFTLMVDKHPILRTGFNMFDFDTPLQILYKSVDLDIKHEDLLHLEKTQQVEYLNAFLEEDRQNGFDISTSRPLWRMRTFALDDETICFIWICHHAIIDGWSSTSLMTELNNTYLRLNAEPASVPDQLKSTYKDFVVEQVNQKRKRETFDFWEKELNDYKRFAFPSMVTQEKTPKGRKLKRYNLDISLLEKLRERGRELNTSVRNLCFSAYVFMLSMFMYENDIVVGFITHNRPACEDGDKIIGCFLNTVPVRIKVFNNNRWRDYIALVDRKLQELKRYDMISLFEIARIIGDNAQDANPITDTIFNFTDFHIYSQFNIENPQVDIPAEDDSLLELDTDLVTNTLFDFSVDTTLGGFRLSIVYSNFVVNDEVVQMCCNYFKNILDMFINKSGEPVSKEMILSLGEKQQLLYQLNDTTAEFPVDKTLQELFEDQVEKSPQNVAAIYEGEELTYEELNRKAAQLARLLRAKGLGTDTIGAIMVERSFDMIVGIIAVLKAGGAYLPVDPEYPQERKIYMLKDSQARVLLMQEHLRESNQEVLENLCPSNIILVDDQKNFSGEASNPRLNCFPHHMAYVIYTSGSTGEPKGVMIEHRAIVNTLAWRTNYYHFNANDVVLQIPSFSFDCSVEEIFTCLIVGSRLVLIHHQHRFDLEYIRELIRKTKVTVFLIVPSFYKTFLEEIHEDLKSIKSITIGGEGFPEELVKLHFRKLPEVGLYNEYGPTEDSVCSTVYPFDRNHTRVLIGKPINNTCCYILDKNRNLNAFGVPGELYIAGAGLSRGYLNEIQLTHEAFVENPFTQDEMIYKTGDIARWVEGGNIEFLGREDHQAKVRGFRIETREIENQLLHHVGLKESIVLPKKSESGDNYLCAYFVADGKQNPAVLKEALRKRLPAYMIPSCFMQVETFPLTPNGKIDYEALPMPVVKAGEDYVAPGNEWEENLVEIWSDVLQRDKDTIGINDNFFELGGHSLKATAVAAKLQKELDVGIPLVEIFNKPTIKELAEYIMEAGTRGIEPGDNNLMLLRRGESPGANHIFFVHDGTGDVEGYIELCNRLKNGFNLWGIRANRSDYYFPWDVTIEDISSYYVKKVKSLQSQGPYYIAGWSLGGTIAFEMVRQLEQGGDEVRFLAMIDVIAPGSKKLGKGSKFTLESEVNWVLDSFTDNEMKEKLKSANHLTQLWSMIGDYLVENNTDTEQLKKIIPENLAKTIPDFEQLRIKELINYFNLYRTLVNARAIYRPNEKINTMIHYFVASRSKKILKPSWNNYSVNPMKLYEIDGDHFSIFKMPHVETLAKIFDTILDSPPHI